MKNFNKKLSLLIITAISQGFCAEDKTFPLANLPKGTILNIINFLPPKDEIKFSKINKYFRNIYKINHKYEIENCIERYARAVVENKPVPQEVKGILNEIALYEDEKNEITQQIVYRIIEKNEGIIKRSASLPPFLENYFKPINDQFLSEIQGKEYETLLPAIKLHLTTCFRYWVNKNTTEEYITYFLQKHILQNIDLHIPIEDAIQILKDKEQIKESISEYIIVYSEDIINRTYFDEINTIFECNPNHKLVIDFGDKVKTTDYFGSNKINSETQYISDSIHHISIVGKYLTTIDYGFLYGCTGLTSLTLPNSIITIGHAFLFRCSGLTSLALSNSIITIGHIFLRECKSLISLILPNSVKNIGNFFLFNCTALTSIKLSNNVANIGDYFLYNCKNLTALTLPESIKIIRDYFLSDCDGLTSLTLQNNRIIIGSNFLDSCTGLTTFTLLNSVISMGERAFYFCTGLDSLKLSNSEILTSGRSFSCYSGLISVTPSNRNIINRKAFPVLK